MRHARTPTDITSSNLQPRSCIADPVGHARSSLAGTISALRPDDASQAGVERPSTLSSNRDQTREDNTVKWVLWVCGWALLIWRARLLLDTVDRRTTKTRKNLPERGLNKTRPTTGRLSLTLCIGTVSRRRQTSAKANGPQTDPADLHRRRIDSPDGHLSIAPHRAIAFTASERPADERLRCPWDRSLAPW